MSNLTQFYTKLRDAKPNTRSDGLNDFIFAFQQEYQFDVSFLLDAGKNTSNLISRFFHE